MKLNLSKILLVFMLMFVLAGCEKFLEKPPEGQMTEEEAFKNEAGLLDFLNGEYTLVGDNDFLGGRIQSITDALADQLDGSRYSGDYAEIFKRQNSIFGGTRDNLYKKGYRIINVANIILGKDSMISAPNKDNVRGQALFFRALSHFELVRLFAQPWGYTNDNSHYGIPLRTEVLIGSVQRATVKEVYDQVIEDLKEAETLLPATYPKYYKATKWAAKALLAKVYFQMNDYANAYAYAADVVNNGGFVLDNNYTNRFSLGLSTEGIFTIANEVNRYQPGGELRGNYRSDQGSIPFLNYTSTFYNFAVSDAADVRKAWYSNTLHAGYFVQRKYNKDNFDLPIIHLTEIKLILAESGAKVGGAALAAAITNINQILTRAYGGPSRNLPTNAVADLVVTTARKERELELVAEGNRYHEIKRIGAGAGVNVDRRNSPWNCNGFILQFPKAEQDAFTAFVMNPEGGCF
ncbi:MAG TPA: RagB/SusD family nutrient uptake outer membrane protein [Chitinophagaceae bacterium]